MKAVTLLSSATGVKPQPQSVSGTMNTPRRSTVLSGCPVGATEGQISPNTLFPFGFLLSCGSAKGDNFGLFVPGLAYFTDNTAAVGNTAFPFIQKMKELGITNGTSLGPLGDARNGTYTFGVTNGAPPAGDAGNLKRKQIATFMVRAFFF